MAGFFNPGATKGVRLSAPTPKVFRFRPRKLDRLRMFDAAQPAAAGKDDFDPEAFKNLMSEISRQLQQQLPTPASGNSSAGTLNIKDVWYQPAGCEAPLLQNINLHLPSNSLGIIYGPSGAGKTTLLQVLAGLRQQTAGTISIAPGTGSQGGELRELDAVGRQRACGLVFQFPERHFVGSNILTEMVLGWPNKASHQAQARLLSNRLPAAMAAVKIQHFPLDTNPSTLSDGYKRRLALAVQLARRPAVLLLDEPLAGLDWKARADLVKLLTSLKSECSLLVISHDLRELAPIVDRAWSMRVGGILEEVSTDLPVPEIILPNATIL